MINKILEEASKSFGRLLVEQVAAVTVTEGIAAFIDYVKNKKLMELNHSLTNSGEQSAPFFFEEGEKFLEPERGDNEEVEKPKKKSKKAKSKKKNKDIDAG